MKPFFTVLLSIVTISAFCQPSSFSWYNPNNSNLNYISPYKDQGEQSPCGIFAAIAAIEAMSHIYYNKAFPYNSGGIDLSEAEMYSMCSGYGANLGAANAVNTLNHCTINGIIDESCLSYPTTSPFYIQPCSKCASPSLKVQIPGYEQFYPNSDQVVKRAIIDYGPIVVSAQNIGGALHPDGGTNGHSFLIIGWSESGWQIKDSWPGGAGIYLNNLNVLSSQYSSKFFRVKYEHNGEVITCTGTGCSSVFSSRSFTDNDGDGFYYWGIGPKPAGCPGPCKMDFNDADPGKIFLDDNYNPLRAPVLDCPDYACSAGSPFRLNNIPRGFSVSWSVSPSSYFNSPISGNDSVAVLYPKTMYTGSTGTITFTITDGCSSINYQKSFTINKPEYERISINVVPSYAPDPILFNEVWLLCRNSTYYIYLNNTSGCSTSNYQWSIPAGWTLYEQTGNYIRINTNETPSAMLTVSATTCCNTNHLIKTQYFGESYSCGGYFMVYPNPATSEVNIEFDDTFDLKTVDKTTTLEIYDSDYSRKYNAEKLEKRIKIKTTGWKRGHYYIIFSYKGQRYYERIAIEN